MSSLTLDIRTCFLSRLHMKDVYRCWPRANRPESPGNHDISSTATWMNWIRRVHLLLWTWRTLLKYSGKSFPLMSLFCLLSVCLRRDETKTRHFPKTSSAHWFWIFTLLELTRVPTRCSPPSFTWRTTRGHRVSVICRFEPLPVGVAARMTMLSRRSVATTAPRPSVPDVSPSSSERCQREIDTVLDGKDQVSFEDRHKMPYVQVCGLCDYRYITSHKVLILISC